MLTNRPTSLKRICRIDMTAFAAVLVVLFFLMMLLDVAGLNPHNGTAVDLPKVGHPVEMLNAMREDALKLGIMRDGGIFFGNDRTTAAELPAKIEERLSHGAERKVYIKADARASYGTVRIVLGAVRSAGVENVGISVFWSNNPTAHATRLGNGKDDELETSREAKPLVRITRWNGRERCLFRSRIY